MSSSHRFLRPSSPSKEPKPISTLRKQVEPSERDAEGSEPCIIPSQFAATPRFGRAKQPAAAPRSPPKLVSALRGAARSHEGIEDTPETTFPDGFEENKRRRVVQPRFKHPAAEASDSQPLPEAFSPHRRGQKFIAGGMAAQMQQHILETGQAARATNATQDFIMRITIEETNGDTPPLAVGTLPG